MRNYTAALAAIMTLAASALFSVGNAAADPDQPYSSAPPATTGSCVFKKTEFSASTSNQNTTLTTFVNLGDGGSISFTQAKAGCVAGSFFANVGNNTSGDNVHLQVLLDGTPCAPFTSDYVFANSDVDLTSHTINFLCGTNVAAGSHTVQVEWAVGVGGEAQMFQHTLEVSHR